MKNLYIVLLLFLSSCAAPIQKNIYKFDSDVVSVIPKNVALNYLNQMQVDYGDFSTQYRLIIDENYIYVRKIIFFWDTRDPQYDKKDYSFVEIHPVNFANNLYVRLIPKSKLGHIAGSIKFNSVEELRRCVEAFASLGFYIEN